MDWTFWFALSSLFGVMSKMNIMDQRLKHIQERLDAL